MAFAPYYALLSYFQAETQKSCLWFTLQREVTFMRVTYSFILEVFHSRQKVIEVGKRRRNKSSFLNVLLKSRQEASEQNTKERDVFEVC